jgi:LysR family hydrogen peroxide-inducible transcriptional activator
MEIHQLRYFCAVAQHGTFTRASEVEHVAQPSLSQQILKLEAELGSRLFDRLPRSARLTVFGNAFLPKAERILQELSEAKTEMLEMAGEEKGEVVLGIIPTIAAYLLPKLLIGFSALHTAIKIKVIEDITPALLERLHQGTVDIVIAALPIYGDELSSLEIFKERFFAVVPEKHSRAKQKSLELAELKNDAFLLLKEGHCFRDSLITACRRSKISPNVAFESGQFATILAMVAAGMGISAVPAMAVQQYPGCCFVPLKGKNSIRKVGVVRLKHHFETRAQGVLVAHIVKCCRSDRDA